MKLTSGWLRWPLAEPGRRCKNSTTKTAEGAFDGFGGEAKARFSRNCADGRRLGISEKASSTQPPKPPKVSPEYVEIIGPWVAALGGPTPPARAARKVLEPASGGRPRLGLPVRRAARVRGAWPAGPAAGPSADWPTPGNVGQDQGLRPRSARVAPATTRFARRVPGFRPGVPLQAFENSGLAGRVRRGVRMFLRGVA